MRATADDESTITLLNTNASVISEQDFLFQDEQLANHACRLPLNHLADSLNSLFIRCFAWFEAVDCDLRMYA